MYLNSCFLFFFLITFLMIIHQTISTYEHLGVLCPNTTEFVNNSAYQTNLNTLFRSLSSNATNNPSGYYQTTVGDPTGEAIYGHYLCRGDLNISSCHGCVTTATTTDLPKTYCPNRKVALIYYDECLVRYSNQSFFGNMDNSPDVNLHNVNSVIGDATKFMEAVMNLTNNVIVQAAEGGAVKKFATGFANYSIFQPIYGLGQCTPDIIRNDCYLCLNSSVQLFHQSPGARVLTPSCYIRYEIYPFFNLSYLPQASQPPKQSPLPSSHSDLHPIVSPSGNKKVSTKLIVSIVAAAVLFIFLAA